MSEKGKDPCPLGAYIMIGKERNTQSSLCGREPMSLGSPLSSGHYFQSICRRKVFINLFFFLVDIELNSRPLLFPGLGEETCSNTSLEYGASE